MYSARMVPFFVEALEVCGAPERGAKEEPVFAAKCWVTSPFRITRENIDIAMAARRLAGIPFTFGHMPVAGGSSPVTVMGSLVQNTAESLALCAMRLALEGKLHEVTATSAVLDMRHM